VYPSFAGTDSDFSVFVQLMARDTRDVDLPSVSKRISPCFIGTLLPSALLPSLSPFSYRSVNAGNSSGIIPEGPSRAARVAAAGAAGEFRGIAHPAGSFNLSIVVHYASYIKTYSPVWRRSVQRSLCARARALKASELPSRFLKRFR